jgi:predicted Zn-dependent protease
MGRFSRFWIGIFLSCVLQAQDARLLADQAAQAMRIGRPADAVVFYEQLAKLVSPSFGLYMNWATAYGMIQQPEKAANLLEKALKLQPQAAEVKALLAQAYLESGQPGKALPILAAQWQKQRENVELGRMVVDSAMAVDQLKVALSVLEQLQRSQPQDAWIWFNAARAHQQMSNQLAGQLTLQSAYWFAAQGELRRVNQNRAAFHFFREALKRNAKIHGVRTQVAQIYRRIEREDWAVEELKRETAACPTNPLSCQFSKGDYVELTKSPLVTEEGKYWRFRAHKALAKQAEDLLMQLGENALTLRYQAEEWRAAEKYAEAAKTFERAVALEPTDQELRSDWVEALILTKDYAAAESALAFLSPDSLRTRFLKSQTLLGQQEAAQAIPLLQQIVTAQPSLLPARAALGRALSQMEKHSDALAHLVAATPTDADGDLHFLLSKTYGALGQKVKAAAALQTYQRIVQQNQETEAKFTITAP